MYRDVSLRLLTMVSLMRHIASFKAIAIIALQEKRIKRERVLWRENYQENYFFLKGNLNSAWKKYKPVIV